ncbi:hypothetical protein Hanom_Chr04g00372391 [Helianthus anomalus]
MTEIERGRERERESQQRCKLRRTKRFRRTTEKNSGELRRFRQTTERNSGDLGRFRRKDKKELRDKLRCPHDKIIFFH